MKRSIRATLILLLTLLWAIPVAAQDGEAVVVYFQSSAFNTPLLPGWDDQSGDDFAQFHLPDADATLRVKIVAQSDPAAAAAAELRAAYGIDASQPIYQDKVNLADGTWTVLVYALDADASASVMSRQADGKAVVISFVERHAAWDIMTLAIARDDESAEDASAEMTRAAALLGLPAPELDAAQIVSLPSGEWLRATDGETQVMGMVFGNDSYVALSDGATELLPQIADAWNTTLLGFFITPDNSLYLALGLAVVFGILALLAFSYFWRWRGIGKDIEVIQSLGEDGEG